MILIFNFFLLQFFNFFSVRCCPLQTAARQRALDLSSQALLGITRSAIHQKWVWSHLLRKRDTALAEFVGAGSAFRGALYDPPAARAHVKTKAAAVSHL